MHRAAWWGLLAVAGCGEKEDDTSEAGALQWHQTCGDPACNEYSGPFEGVPICSGEAAGASCAERDARCDLEDPCNVLLICADEDPRQQEGGCPISLRRYKRQVRYLSGPEVEQVRQQALQTPLARWQYTWEDPAASRTHLGFLIDDVPGSPAVRADGQHVDLYGYTSLAIGAVQAQQADIDALRAELAALRTELAQVRGTCAAADD